MQSKYSQKTQVFDTIHAIRINSIRYKKAQKTPICEVTIVYNKKKELVKLIPIEQLVDKNHFPYLKPDDKQALYQLFFAGNYHSNLDYLTLRQLKEHCINSLQNDIKKFIIDREKVFYGQGHVCKYFVTIVYKNGEKIETLLDLSQLTDGYWNLFDIKTDLPDIAHCLFLDDIQCKKYNLLLDTSFLLENESSSSSSESSTSELEQSESTQDTQCGCNLQ
jgi:hypothetical protein